MADEFMEDANMLSSLDRADFLPNSTESGSSEGPVITDLDNVSRRRLLLEAEDGNVLWCQNNTSIESQLPGVGQFNIASLMSRDYGLIKST
jgi:hypothetical protein